MVLVLAVRRENHAVSRVCHAFGHPRELTYVGICCLDPDHDYFSQALVKDSLALCVLVHLAATAPEVFVMSIRVDRLNLSRFLNHAATFLELDSGCMSCMSCLTKMDMLEVSLVRITSHFEVPPGVFSGTDVSPSMTILTRHSEDRLGTIPTRRISRP